MKNRTPKVSIVIPCWNAERYIADAIGSCLGQSYWNLEVVVVNDGSTDKSQSVIDYFGKQIVSIIVPNGGSNKARNIGLKASSGDLIKFLDADDFLWPGSIAKQVEHIQRKDERFISIGESFVYYESSGKRVVRYPSWSEGHCVSREVAQFIIHPPAISNALYWRDHVLNINGFDEGILARQEVDLFYRCILSGNIPVLLKEPVFVYRNHHSLGRVSATKFCMAYQSDIIFLRNAHKKLAEVKHMSEFQNANEALAFATWRMGRDMMRNGYAEEAEILFDLAKQCSPRKHVMGRIPYRLANRVIGPQAAESLFTLLKKIIITRNSFN